MKRLDRRLSVLEICPSFIQYLRETAPSLFYQAPLDSISFRWKIPNQELLGGWTSPKSGIDIIKELRTDEICGFIGIHFPGREFLSSLAVANPGPYSPLCVVDAMHGFLSDHGENFGEHFACHIRHHAIKASERGCVLKYADKKTEEPLVLTGQEFFRLSPPRVIH